MILTSIRRRKLWEIFSNIKEIKQRNFKGSKINYNKLRSQKSKYMKQIQKDVSRTYNFSPFFKKVSNFTPKIFQNENIQSLIDVLIAYANFDCQLGYTQGMNFIAANLLLCCDFSENDQDLNDIEVLDCERDKTVFYLMIHIMIDKNWGTLFQDGFPGLIQQISQFDSLFKSELPELFQHFRKIGIQDNIPLFQSYFFTLLMYDMPMSFSRNILDLFLFQGEIFIHNFILAMLKTYNDQILQFSFEETFFFCKQQMLKDFMNIFQDNQVHNQIQTFERLGLIKAHLIDQNNNNEQQIQSKRKLSIGEKLKLYFQQ